MSNPNPLHDQENVLPEDLEDESNQHLADVLWDRKKDEEAEKAFEEAMHRIRQKNLIQELGQTAMVSQETLDEMKNKVDSLNERI